MFKCRDRSHGDCNINVCEFCNLSELNPCKLAFEETKEQNHAYANDFFVFDQRY